MLLSICIPNYNRKNCLKNCLNSILISKKISKLSFEVCISDNCSDENIEDIILEYSKNLRTISFHGNAIWKKRLGKNFKRNFLEK